VIISVRSPDCIHDYAPVGSRQAASNCTTCPTDNVQYQRWCEFWDSLPYMWQWDPPKPDSFLIQGHWEERTTGIWVADAVVVDHLRSINVTVVYY
jgi:hypothetical protein